jgi:hypothetical protein
VNGRPPAASVAADQQGADRERGAALVEFAIVATLLLALVFGIIDFGNMYHQAASQRQGTQQAARFAAVGDFGPCAGSATERIVCQVKDLIGGTENVAVRVVVPDTYTRGNPLIVCSERPRVSITGFFAPFMDGRYSRSVAYVRIEQTDSSGTPTTGGDVAPSGSWAWCA